MVTPECLRDLPPLEWAAEKQASCTQTEDQAAGQQHQEEGEEDQTVIKKRDSCTQTPLWKPWKRGSPIGGKYRSAEDIAEEEKERGELLARPFNFESEENNFW